MKTALFICTGNFYRSRLAEILFNHYAAEAGLEWRAISRGLGVRPEHRGISPYVEKYLFEKGLGELGDSPRNPQPVLLDELAEAGRVILMSRAEHFPVLAERFSWMVRMLENRSALTCWNVYDIPVSLSMVQSLLAPQKFATSQPPDSGMEHVDFAVRALVADLLLEQGAAAGQAG